MDWLWPLYEQHIRRERAGGGDQPADGPAPPTPEEALAEAFFRALAESTATLYAMEPVGETIRFKGLGRWPLSDVPELLADPNGFIATRCGGGKFKVNFHHGRTFVATHNFRTFGEETWRQLPELEFDE